MKTLLIALTTAALWGISIVALHVSDQPVRAQESTPTPIVDLGLQSDAVFSLIGPEPKITWRAFDGVDHFQLTATLQAGRVSRADPFLHSTHSGRDEDDLR
jgi:hypothetical protein